MCKRKNPQIVGVGDQPRTNGSSRISVDACTRMDLCTARELEFFDSLKTILRKSRDPRTTVIANMDLSLRLSSKLPILHPVSSPGRFQHTDDLNNFS